MDVKSQSLADATIAPVPAVNRERDGWSSFAWFLIKLLVLVLAFRTLAFSPFSIPSESMLPRLMNGDYLLAAKWPYGYSRQSLPFDLPLPDGRLLASAPERGDVVIFKHPIDGRDYIKRVIGLPGDSVAVVGGQVVLNGKPVPRERIGDFKLAMSANTGCAWAGQTWALANGSETCSYVRYRETLPSGKTYEVLDFGTTPGDNIAPVTVPDGAMFVMGDNRDNSRDSRWPAAAGDAVGLVPQRMLVGRAMLVVWSTDGGAEWVRPWTWFSAARWNRIGGGL
ncbi:signal peptidase I [Erythrobacter sp.]|uniref:signal peptidase I n=1 Tax=Erythrobacter sp. TaxID=1042 RepID=UPI0025D0B505|nr:signal peptidase I [Erythrobacter sp.]